MSYCRFSSDNLMCDLYCYETVGGGYMTHIAAKRIVNAHEMPHVDQTLISSHPNDLSMPQDEALRLWRRQSDERQRWIDDKAVHEEIKLPHAGDSLHDPDLESFLLRLISLRALGYHFPEDVIERVKEEMKEKENDDG